MSALMTRRRSGPARGRDHRQASLFSQVAAPAPREDAAAAPTAPERADHEPAIAATTLEEAITALWADLSSGEPADCPVCGAAMEPRHSAGAGVVGGGLLAVANFRQLVGRVLAFSASRPRRAPWLIAAAARLVVLLSAAAALMVTGWIDPIGFVVGLAVLPCAVIVEGLVTARTA